MVINAILPQNAVKQLNALEYASGYVLEETRLSLTDAPTLIIGVGGTGVDAITYLKHKYERDYRKSDRLHFLGIDTDSNAASNASHSDEVKTTMLEPDNDEWFHLEGAIGKALEEDHTWDDTIREFCPVNSGIDPGDDGAGGFRVASRFIFFRNISNLKTKLERIINRLKDGYDGGKGLNIFLVTGIAGGTGSGASLDLAYFIRALLNSEWRLKPNSGGYNLVGYIILPDVNDTLGKNHYNGSNGYAYLKELDYFNSLKANGETFTQNYGSCRYNGQDGPFDLTYLFGATDAKGTQIANAYAKSQINIAESILDSLADVTDKDGSKTFIQSLISNINNNLLKMKTSRDDVEYSRYVSIGNASFRLPLRELTQYLSARLFDLLDEPTPNSDKTNQLFQNSPGVSDRLAVFNTLALDREGALRLFEGTFERGNHFDHTGWKNQLKNNYSYERVIKTESVPVLTHIREDITKPATDSLLKYKKKVRQETLEKAEKLLDGYLTDTNRGPLYIARLFGDNLQNDGGATGSSISAHIDAFVTDLEEAVKTLERELANQQSIREGAFTEKPSLLGKSKTTIVENYIKACLDEVELEKNLIGCRSIAEVMKDIKDDLENLYNTKYGRIAKALIRLRDNGVRFIANTLPALKTQEEVLEKNSNVYSFINFDQVIQSVEANLIVEKKRNLDELKRNFLSQLGQDQERFINNDSVDIIGFLHTVIKTEMTDNLETAFLDLLKWAAYANSTGDVQKSFDHVIAKTADDLNVPDFINKQIATPLSSKSQPQVGLVAAHHTYIDEIKNKIYRTALLPAGLGDVMDKGLSNRGFALEPTSREDSLSAYQFIYGFPLYTLPYLAKYEVSYEEALKSNNEYSLSLHLFCTDQIKYSDLPSLIPVIERNDVKQLPRLDTILQEREALFEACLKYGFAVKNSDDTVTLRNGDHTLTLKGTYSDGKALKHFQKLYLWIKELEVLVKQKDRQAGGDMLVKLFATGILTNTPGTSVYNLNLAGTEMELGNFYKERAYVEHSLVKAVEEKLTDAQRKLYFEEAEQLFDTLTRTAEGGEKIEAIKAELAQRVEEVEKVIILNNPANAAELFDFYQNLKQVL